MTKNKPYYDRSYNYETIVKTKKRTNKRKETKGGENPYMFVAEKLGIADELDKQINVFIKSERTEKDYQKLIDWEVQNFTKAYAKLYGVRPMIGDLENMLPASKVTNSAKRRCLC